MDKRTTILKTLSLKVRDKHMKVLSRMAFEANQVWNAANDITADYVYVPVPGVGYIRNLAKSRKQFKTDKLRWRASGGSRRSLGWVPFKSGAVKWKNGHFYFVGDFFKFWSPLSDRSP